MRAGFSEQQTALGIELGLTASHYSYWLDQKNYVEGVNRSQHESWLEFGATWGLVLRFTGFFLHYSGSVTTGTGIPTAAGPWRIFAAEAAMDKSHFLIAPTGTLAVNKHEVYTHRFALVIPLKQK